MNRPLLIGSVAAVVILVPMVALAAGGTTPDTYTPPCTANTDTCRQQRIVALENHYRQHVHPSPLPSTSVTPTSSAIATPSSTLTPSATATSATPITTPAATGFPSASSTGVPAGTSLTVVTGAMTITTPNTVVDSKDIRGCVEVKTTGVIIRKSKINANCFYTVYSHTSGSLLIEDSEIACADTTSSTALGDTNITARRVDVHGCENGFDIDGNVTVEDSWIHDLANSGASHTDGIQLSATDGHDVLVKHNSIDGGIGTSAMIMNTTGANGVTVSNNRLAGGAYTLYCPIDRAGVNVRVLSNRFVRSAAYGPWTECGDEAEVSGNVWDDTSAPLVA